MDLPSAPSKAEIQALKNGAEEKLRQETAKLRAELLEKQPKTVQIAVKYAMSQGKDHCLISMEGAGSFRDDVKAFLVEKGFTVKRPHLFVNNYNNYVTIGVGRIRRG
jgi:hypothetical protein